MDTSPLGKEGHAGIDGSKCTDRSNDLRVSRDRAHRDARKVFLAMSQGEGLSSTRSSLAKRWLRDLGPLRLAVVMTPETKVPARTAKASPRPRTHGSDSANRLQPSSASSL